MGRALGTWFAISLGVASSCGGARALSDAPSPPGESEPRGVSDAAAPQSSAARADAAEAPTRSIVVDAAGASEAGAASADAGDGLAPTPVAASRRALAVAIGETHACALLDNHVVRCWGSGVTAGDPGPPRAAVAIAAAFHETCAILDDGSVTCWAPGAGSAWDESNVSIALGPGRRAVSLTMEPSLACAVLDDGSASCWGDAGPAASPKTLLPPDGGPPLVQLGLNEAGDLLSLYADGTVGGEGTLSGLAPGRLLQGRPTATIAAARGDTAWCAMLVGGGGYCAYQYFDPPPRPTVLTQIAMTNRFLCGVRPTGTVSCWAVGGDIPECDDGSVYWCRPGRNSDASYDVALDQPALSVAMGPASTPVACAVLVDGSVWCWRLEQTCTVLVDGGVRCSGLEPSASSDCNDCDGILGDSAKVTRTDAGLQHGPWRAIDLGAPP